MRAEFIESIRNCPWPNKTTLMIGRLYKIYHIKRFPRWKYWCQLNKDNDFSDLERLKSKILNYE